MGERHSCDFMKALYARPVRAPELRIAQDGFTCVRRAEYVQILRLTAKEIAAMASRCQTDCARAREDSCCTGGGGAALDEMAD